jgi:hypothetical protein
MTTRAYCFLELNTPDDLYSTKVLDNRHPSPMAVPIGKYRLHLKIKIIRSELEIEKYKLFLDGEKGQTMLKIDILSDAYERTSFKILPANINRSIWGRYSGGVNHIDIMYMYDFEVTAGVTENSIHIGPFECRVWWLDRVGSPSLTWSQSILYSPLMAFTKQ